MRNYILFVFLFVFFLRSEISVGQDFKIDTSLVQNCFSVDNRLNEVLIDDTDLEELAFKRYGAISSRATEALELFSKMISRHYKKSSSVKSFLCETPSLAEQPRNITEINRATEKLFFVIELLLEDREFIGESDRLRFDVVDITRRMLCNIAVGIQNKIRTAYEIKDLKTFDKSVKQQLSLLFDLDNVSKTRSEFLLGYYIEKVRGFGYSKAEKEKYEIALRKCLMKKNAESIVMKDDCVNSMLGGLIGSFYYKQWKQFYATLRLQLLDDSMNNGISTLKKFHEDLSIEKEKFIQNTKTVYPYPEGDEIEIVLEVLESFKLPKVK